VQGLGVLRVACEGVGAVESAVVGVVISGAEVILLQVSITSSQYQRTLHRVY